MSGRFFVWSSFTTLAFFFLITQDGPQPVDVFRDHRQGDITFETVDSMIRALIQPVHFECVDGGFHRGVLAAQELEFRRTFSLPFSFCEAAFFGKHNKIQQFFEIKLILLAVGALVPTDDRKIGESFFGFFDYFHCHLVIGLPAHHLMVEDETVMVFDDVDSESEFHRHSRLALADPLGVGLEDGEDFFMMGDGFVHEDPADDLAHEFFRIAHVLTQEQQFHGRQRQFLELFQVRLDPHVIGLGHDDVFEIFLAPLFFADVFFCLSFEVEWVRFRTM